MRGDRDATSETEVQDHLFGSQACHYRRGCCRMCCWSGQDFAVPISSNHVAIVETSFVAKDLVVAVAQELNSEHVSNSPDLLLSAGGQEMESDHEFSSSLHLKHHGPLVQGTVRTHQRRIDEGRELVSEYPVPSMYMAKDMELWSNAHDRFEQLLKPGVGFGSGCGIKDAVGCQGNGWHCRWRSALFQNSPLPRRRGEEFSARPDGLFKIRQPSWFGSRSGWRAPIVVRSTAG